ncbi:hypothetical protein F5Y14DRAFT_416475 [Nemania sp. NC0429]|nr:hypothetical protein F5Y14DRAFT_416475 [Nemania sp. NC0429]
MSSGPPVPPVISRSANPRNRRRRHGRPRPSRPPNPPPPPPPRNDPPQNDPPQNDPPQPETQQVAPEPRPMSPWNQRFGVAPLGEDQIYQRSIIEHSRFAPSRPPLDPKFYADRPLPYGHHVFKDLEEADMHYHSEIGFTTITRGMMPWQLGPLNRTLQFSTAGSVPGGHSQATPEQLLAHEATYRSEGLKVDEDSWFPLFKKDRWFSTDSNDSVLTGKSWSVDDPVVWKELRVSLELANRILTALIKDKHHFLETMLFGQLGYWENTSAFTPPTPEPFPHASVLLSSNFIRAYFARHFPKLPCPVDEISAYGEEVWKERLEKFTATQEWGLAILNSDTGRQAGATFDHHEHFILINPIALRSMMEGKLTLAESCAARFFTAITILHELMHAIRHHRAQHDDDRRYNTLDLSIDNSTEPFVDYGGTAEMGYAFENAVFGGPFREVFVPSRTPAGSMIPLGTIQVTWPFLPRPKIDVLGLHIDTHPDYSPRRQNVTSAVPALFFSRILSEEFWQDATTPRKSDGYFHRSDFFCFAKITSGEEEPTLKQTTMALHPRPQLESQRANGTLPKVVSDMLTDWELSENLWNEVRRGWYEGCKLTWLQSAWCNIPARRQLALFGEEMAKAPHDRDIYTLVSHAMWMIDSIELSPSRSRSQYLEDIRLTGCHWVFHAIGYLMLASLPLRSTESTRDQWERTNIVHFFPSATVPESRRVVKEFEWSWNKTWYPTECVETQLVDPFRREGQQLRPEDIDHVDYLNFVVDILGVLAHAGYPISTPWLREIIRVEAAIRETRNHLAATSPNPRLEWAEGWDFKMPTYDALSLCVWDKTKLSWVRKLD